MKVATVFALLLVSATAFNAPQFATRAVGKAPATKAVKKGAAKKGAAKKGAAKKAPFSLKGASAVRRINLSPICNGRISSDLNGWCDI